MLVPQRQDPVKILLTRVPEVRALLDQCDLDLPYIVVGMVVEALKTQVLYGDATKRAFDVLNDLAETGEPELETLVQVGALEQIADDDRLRRYADEPAPKIDEAFAKR
jgi:hypothetical protein